MDSGIYKITCRKNNKYYVGGSIQITKRWKRHLKDLKCQTHHNINLQLDWDLFGEDEFDFEIIEHLSNKEDIVLKEQEYLDNGDTSFMYNIGKNSSGGDNLTNNPKLNEIKEKHSQNSKQMWDSDRGEELKLSYSEKFKKEGNPNWKGGVTFCACGNRKNMYAETCSECRDRTGDKNPFYGKKHTDEFKKRASELRKGKYTGNQNIPISIDDVEYRSYGEAGLKLNMCVGTVRWRVRSTNPKFDNYKFI